jgi:polyribonucleotide nucleotidyltransferase
MSSDKNRDPDIAALIGTSAALSISGIPFNGPIGAARVGYKDGMYILNPSYSELAESALDLVVAGTEPAVLMVESEAQELSEDQMLGAVLFGHMEMQPLIQGIKEFAAEVGTETWDWKPAEQNETLKAAIKDKFAAALGEAYTITEKMARYAKVGELREACVAEFATGEEGAPEAGEVKELFGKIEKMWYVKPWYPASRVSMAVLWTLSVQSIARWAPWPKPTVLRCSPVVKPRPS